MLVLKNKATNLLLGSEKQSLLRFLTLYITMVLLIIILVAAYYFQTQEKLFISQQRAILYKYAYIHTKRLKVLHHFFDTRREYPRDTRFRSAIYDIEKKKIFSLLKNNYIQFDKEIYFTGKYIHFVKSLDEYYLGTKYIIIEIRDDLLWKDKIWKDIFLYGSIFFLVFLLFGLYLAKLFLKPMRNSIVLLDRFIKDTTHELNTPLSAILANIEMMNIGVMSDTNKTKLNRINIAAKTVSNLYKDLTYLTLEQEKPNDDVLIDVKQLIENRTEYFYILAQSKKIEYHFELSEASIYMDKRKFTRIIDNIISNAIKYNKRGGDIRFVLSEGQLIIWDTGIGIADEKIPFMFNRYQRFNKSEGGFGIGLNIVKKIIDEYQMSITVSSEKHKGTRITISW